MNRILVFSAAIFLLFGCAGGGAHTADRSTAAPVEQVTAAATSAAVRPDGNPTQTGTATDAAAASDKDAAAANADRPPKLEATQAVDESQAWSQSSGGLTVKLFSAAEVQVSQPQYRVAGKAPAGTVVTVNDEILVVDGSQAFSTAVALTDGPNLIEVVASSPSGDEVNFLLVVTFDSPN